MYLQFFFIGFIINLLGQFIQFYDDGVLTKIEFYTLYIPNQCVMVLSAIAVYRYL